MLDVVVQRERAAYVCLGRSIDVLLQQYELGLVVGVAGVLGRQVLPCGAFSSTSNLERDIRVQGRPGRVEVLAEVNLLSVHGWVGMREEIVSLPRNPVVILFDLVFR